MTKVIVPPAAAKILTPSLVASRWLNQYQHLVADTTAVQRTLLVVNRLRPPAIGVPTTAADLLDWRLGIRQTSQLAEGFLRPLLQALRIMQRDRQKLLRIVFRPGTFLGDVLLVLDPDCTDDVRYQALRRLATKHLTLRYTYQSSPGLQRRWSKVRPHFEAYCREHGLSYGRAWEQLAAPVICDLLLHLPGDVTFGELRWYLARELRKEIERELLGRTVDQHDPIDRVMVADDIPDELVDVRLEAWLALQRLDPLDRELLIAVFVHGQSYSELAAQYGVSERTIRRRLMNALRRLRYE
jgi:RNA polymerase sigma factor (sigma-70 family)